MFPFWVGFTPQMPLPVQYLASPMQLVQHAEDVDEHVTTLLETGHAQSQSGDYLAAAESFQTALELLEEDDFIRRGEALYGLSDAYLELEAYAEALPVFEAAIALFTDDAFIREGNFAESQAESQYVSILVYYLGVLGKVHHQLAHFGTAQGYYQQALDERTLAFVDLQTQADLLANKGLLEIELGQYADAEQTLQDSIALQQQLGSTYQEADATTALALAYERQGKFEQAIAYYQTASDRYQQAGSISGETLTANNLGMLYLKQDNQTAAEDILSHAQTLLGQEANPYHQAIVLDSFGMLYQAQGNTEKAWLAYREARALSIENNEKVAEIETLLNLALLMESQSQPDLAIFFYKQAIAHIETIRQDLQQLSAAVQSRYTLTVEDFYRNLADLLLQQDRTDEAVQILDLLKVQEIEAYLHSDQTADTHALLSPAELALSTTLKNSPENLTLTDFTALPQVASLTAPSAESPSAESPSTEQSSSELPSAEPPSTAQISINSATNSVTQTTIEALQSKLAAQPENTAALYPLILEDRLEIVLVTAEGASMHYSQSVTQSELAQTIQQFQNKLKTDVLEPTAEAQQLYRWIIRPLEQTLAQQEIENIIYLPDGVLRYVPIAAFHDGQQWFSQRYQSHNITAMAIDDLDRHVDQPNAENHSVLAGAFTDASPDHTVRVGQQSYPYAGLPAAREEISNILQLMPQTTALFDQNFTPDNTLKAADTHQIVHLATHARFLPGQPEDSFILFGDGSTVNMRDVGQWQLPGVDLVVFSACQTAASIETSSEEDGKELLGLGFQVQQTGAGAAIASLWSVNDEATAALMTQFYTALSTGKTKAEALQYAQQQLMNTPRYSHPYHWSGFVLIGNGS